MSSQDSQLEELKISLVSDKTRSRRSGPILNNSLALLLPEQINIEEVDTTATVNPKDTSKISIPNDTPSVSLSEFQEALKKYNPSIIQLPYHSALLIKLLKTSDIGLYISYTSGASPMLIKYCLRSSKELGSLSLDLTNTFKILVTPNEEILILIRGNGVTIIDLKLLGLYQEPSFTDFKIITASISLNSYKMHFYTDKHSIVSYDFDSSKTKTVFDLGDYQLKHLGREYAFLSTEKELCLFDLDSKQILDSKSSAVDIKSAKLFLNFENTLAVFFDPNRLQILIQKIPSLEKVNEYKVEDKIAKAFFTADDKALILYYENSKLGVFLIPTKERPITYDTLIQIDKKFLHFNPLTGVFYANDILHDTYKWNFLENSFEALNIKTSRSDLLKISNKFLYELEGNKVNVRELESMNIVNSYAIPNSTSFDILNYGENNKLAVLYHSYSNISVLDLDTFETLQDIVLETAIVKKVISFYLQKQLIILDRNNIRIYDMNSKQIEANVFAAHIHEISDGLIAQSSQLLITTSLDKTIKIWDLSTKDCIFIDKLIYKDSEFVCLAVDSSEEYLFGGNKSNTVVVWHLHNRHLIIEYEFISQIAKILFTQDNTFFLIAEIYGKITLGHLKTFCKVTEIDMMVTLVDLCFDKEEQYFYVFSKLSIKKFKNPLKSDSVTIYGNVPDTCKYFPLLDDMCVKGKVPAHDHNFDKLIFSPGGITSLHIYVYFGMAKHLKKCLKERIVIIPDRNGQTPLDMCMQMKDTELLGLFLDALIREIPKNKYLATVFEESIVKINYTGHPILDDLYRALFRISTDHGIPRFCDNSVNLPISVHSQKKFIDPKLFTHPKNYESKNQMITFQEALIPLNFNIGSEESIEFLKSIIECPNSEIFHTPLIREYLLGKWKIARKGMLLQMFLYIVYMSSLLFHVFSEHYSVDMWMILTTDFTIMFFEFYQMYINGSDYWDDVWNYLDVVRALLCKIYMIYLVLDYDKSKEQFLTLLLLISFWRGIAYYRLFKDTRYLINLIFEVLSDIRAFLILLVYTTIAHIVLGVLINRIYGRETNWAEDILGAYGILFGDMERPSDIIHWIILTINLIVDPIIMLNLLISIIGATYERVEENNAIADMKEMAEMILEVETYSLWNRNKSGKYYLHICAKKEMLDTEIGGSDSKLKAIDKKLGILIQTIKSDIKAAQKAAAKNIAGSLMNGASMKKLIGLGNVPTKLNPIEEVKGDTSHTRAPTRTNTLFGGLGGLAKTASKDETIEQKDLTEKTPEVENSVEPKPLGLLGRGLSFNKK